MLISLTNLVAMRKIQKNIWNKVRLVSLININTKEWQNKPPFMKVAYLLGTVLGTFDRDITMYKRIHWNSLFFIRN